ncbi:hypothetical protein [Mycolicibacterium komossense]|uniref:Uncharacterized protein n=1 Tax=Mycolicibacterium komossense TaxID=1779 RepID=A0ABT3CA19_9MYCO|nr:hypothetical protein [Mycolicibacterium komossense]MCV7226081.1 hypothetical protein [Mycolicibacterium komossense]
MAEDRDRPMNPPCRRCGHLGRCRSCVADPEFEFRPAIPRVSEDDWFYLLKYPDHTVVQCAGDWDVALKHLRALRIEYEAEQLAATGRRAESTVVLIGAYGPNRVGGPEGRGGVRSFGITPTLIGSIDVPRAEWIPA